MGGGLKADLSQGAVPALWSEPPPPTAEAEEWQPVLQVVSVTPMPDGNLWLARTAQPGPAQYRLRLSDGVHSQYATLASTLDPLASCGALRRGSVVRLLRFVSIPDPKYLRTIFIFELKILQTKCPLIGSLKLYEPPRNSEVSSTSRSMLSQQTSREAVIAREPPRNSHVSSTSRSMLVQPTSRDPMIAREPLRNSHVSSTSRSMLLQQTSREPDRAGATKELSCVQH